MAAPNRTVIEHSCASLISSKQLPVKSITHLRHIMLMKVIYKVDRSSKVPMIARNNMKLEEWTKQARFIATTKQDTSTGIYNM